MGIVYGIIFERLTVFFACFHPSVSLTYPRILPRISFALAPNSTIFGTFINCCTGLLQGIIKVLGISEVCYLLLCVLKSLMLTDVIESLPVCCVSVEAALFMRRVLLSCTLDWWSEAAVASKNGLMRRTSEMVPDYGPNLIKVYSFAIVFVVSGLGNVILEETPLSPTPLSKSFVLFGIVSNCWCWSICDLTACDFHGSTASRTEWPSV